MLMELTMVVLIRKGIQNLMVNLVHPSVAMTVGKLTGGKLIRVLWA
jgi:hypothetical protein